MHVGYFYMSRNCHIIIKIRSAKLAGSSCPVRLVLKDGNKKDSVDVTLVFNSPDNNVFHVAHESTAITNVDSVNFYLLSKNKSDTLLLDCVEVIDQKTKRYRYFPCKQWVAGSTIKDEIISVSGADKTGSKRNCFEIIRGKNRQYYFRLRAGNSEIVAQSEGYKSKASAIKGIKAIQRIIPNAVIYDVSPKRTGSRKK